MDNKEYLELQDRYNKLMAEKAAAEMELRRLHLEIEKERIHRLCTECQGL